MHDITRSAADLDSSVGQRKKFVGDRWIIACYSFSCHAGYPCRTIVLRCRMLVPMAKRKNPAAVALGRKGGKKTGRKGLAAMDPVKRREIQEKAWAARRKQDPGIQN